MFTRIQALRDALAASGLSTYAIAKYTRIESEDIDCVLVGLLPLHIDTLRELLGPTGFVYTDRLLAHPDLLYPARLQMNTALALADKVRSWQDREWVERVHDLAQQRAERIEDEMARWWLQEWLRLLDGEQEVLIEAMLSYDNQGHHLRAYSPLAMLLSEDERLRVVSTSQEQGQGCTDDPARLWHLQWVGRCWYEQHR